MVVVNSHCAPIKVLPNLHSSIQLCCRASMGKLELYNVLEIIIRKNSSNLIIYKGETGFNHFFISHKSEMELTRGTQISHLTRSIFTRSTRHNSRDSCMVSTIVRVPPRVSEESIRASREWFTSSSEHLHPPDESLLSSLHLSFHLHTTVF